ncbi:uncharacterized protein EKO05_0009399 [Ascochyta rabiei]|uniref:Uncharacterized protein n=1 Tax=Didymella rabiei TaxID=5454 RepID=A0A162WCN9_DIDRA|nr:uncharacterized protein EKO05_0009399 [Ascochyta rabiei]KZM18951.1 hypothetical protein ST47_g9909 [Ascochyta rabiei]UPX19127.1 hypothetical protein EKO05_0009399 [Ascochyta rabiei]
MRFTIATIAAMAAAAGATVIPRSDLGAWNVTVTRYGGADRAHGEIVTGVYANDQLADNIPVTCRFDNLINGEIVQKTTCNPDSFSYKLDGDDLTLTQTLTLGETNVTVSGSADALNFITDGINGKTFIAHDVLVTATTGVA